MGRFFDISQINLKPRKRKEWDTFPIVAEHGKSFQNGVILKGALWQWGRRDCSLMLKNFSNQTQNLEFLSEPTPKLKDLSSLIIRFNEGPGDCVLEDRGRKLRCSLKAKPGVNILKCWATRQASV